MARFTEGHWSLRERKSENGKSFTKNIIKNP
jgi:hypothetical protein